MVVFVTNSNMIVLKAGGARTIVEEEEAGELRARFESELEQFGECHLLNLSCRAWRIGSLKILEPIFMKVKETVRTLLIDDIIASLPTEEGLSCFEYIAGIFSAAPQLNRVNLNDNAIGSRGIKYLRPLLTNASVIALSLENCGLAESDGAILKELLLAEGTSRKLLELSLSRNQMGAAGAAYIGELLGDTSTTNLQSFMYAGSRPLATGTKALCRGLAELANKCGQRGTMLHTLDLNDCTVQCDSENDSCVSDLCTVLRHSPRLQKLILRDAELNVLGLKMVMDALVESGAPLNFLDLGVVGELGKEGGLIVRDFLTSNSPACACMQELYLDTNELGDEGAAEVLTGITSSMRSLRVLDLGGNELSSIVTLFLHNHIPTLHTLKLEDNPDLEAGEGLRNLRGMYRDVLVDDDIDENVNDDDDGDDADQDSVVALVDNFDLLNVE